MPENTYPLGIMEGQINFQLPSREKAKLDVMANRAPVIGRTFNQFSRGGAAMFAAFSTVALLFGAGQGFRMVFGMLWDILGLLSDLLFIQLLPFIQPLIGALADFTISVAQIGSGGMGEAVTSFTNAIFNAEAWGNAGKAFATWIFDLKNWGGLIMGLANFLGGFNQKVADIVTKFGLAMISYTAGFIEGMVNALKNAFIWIGQKAIEIGSSIASAILDGLGSLLGGVGGAIGQVGSGIGKGSQNAWQTGMSWVPGRQWGE